VWSTSASSKFCNNGANDKRSELEMMSKTLVVVVYNIQRLSIGDVRHPRNDLRPSSFPGFTKLAMGRGED